MSVNDGLLPPDMPSENDRIAAIRVALKNSKWASGAVNTKEPSDEEKARIRLEAFVLKLIPICIEVKTLDEAKTGLPFDEQAMSRLVMEMFRQFNNGESSDSLSYMLAMVHTPLIIEALKELQ
jgi:hypothetical protein